MASTTAGPSRTSLNPYQQFPSAQPKNERLKFSSAHPFIPIFVEAHLSKSKNLDPKALYEARVKGRPVLLENPVRDSKLKKAREEKKGRRAKELERKRLGLISKRETKLKGLWKLEKAQKRFELFVPLHHLWLGYMSELLGLNPPPTRIPESPTMPNSLALHAKLVKADFHGSLLTVKQAKNPCLVGASGIVIHESENAFKIINVMNQVRMIPKQGIVFAFRIPLYDVRSLVPPLLSPGQSSTSISTNSTALDLDSIPQMEFELYGNQFRFRAADRAGRKFKAKETIEI